MNCCRIAGLDFFLSFFPTLSPFLSPSLSSASVCLLVCVFSFLFAIRRDGLEGRDPILRPKLSKVPFLIFPLQAHHEKSKVS